MLIGLHSAVVEVGDLEAAVASFSRLLERGPERLPEGPRAVFDLGNTCLELQAGRAASMRADRGHSVESRDGLVRLRFAFRAGAGGDAGHFVAGPIASPTVPLELVGESDASSRSGSRAGTAAGAYDGTVRDATRSGVVGLDHVVIATRSPERVRAFLADDLGIRLALDRTFPERGLRLLFFRLGGVTLEVAAALTPPPGGAAGAGVRRGMAHPDTDTDIDRAIDSVDEFRGLAWKVRGLDATRARLEAAGLALSSIRPGHKAGTRVCSLRAPLCGIPTLLIEHPARDGEGTRLTSEGESG